MKLTRSERFVLLVTLLAAMAARAFHLGAGSLWYDETVSVYLAGSPVPELLRHTAGDIHPPGYYLLLRVWLLLSGYPTGHADAGGQGLEFASAFLSMCFGVLLIALAYALARRLAGPGVALLAAALLALSPYNIWYGQEVRMYTLAAALGLVAMLALWQALGGASEQRSRGAEERRSLSAGAEDAARGIPYPVAPSEERRATWAGVAGDPAPPARPSAPLRPRSSAPRDGLHYATWRWWIVYALAAAAGMYTLYYFAFLLLPLNLWVATRFWTQRGGAGRGAEPPRAPGWRTWLLANAAALALYVPWVSVAWRQATQPPVPAWRTAVAVGAALRESWTALVAGQAAPDWAWPAALVCVPIYLLGLFALSARQRRRAARPALASQSAAPAPRSPDPDSKLAAEKPHLTTQPTSLPHQMDPQSLAGERKAHFLPRAWERLPGVLAAEPSPARLAAPATLLLLATFGSLALVLLASVATPLYHVRYVFTYSPAFFIVLASGLAWLWRRVRPLAPVVAGLWLVVAGATTHAYWYNPVFQPDDHRAAVAYLQANWRPGDVLLVNAGYAYTALATYWQPDLSRGDRSRAGQAAAVEAPAGAGPDAGWRGRLTGALPAPPGGNSLVALTTGHVDGGPGLGWGDPRSDFFALPASAARSQIQQLYQRFSRIWQYRIYDTVNDPQGVLRVALAQGGQVFVDRVFPGEAFLRVQGFASASVAAPDPAWPTAHVAGMTLQAAPMPATAAGGDTIYPVLWWLPGAAGGPAMTTSLRLADGQGQVWAQPPDEEPLGPQFTAQAWPAGRWQRQALALTIPPGTPPGRYRVVLVTYDPGNGRVWPVQTGPGGLAAEDDSVSLDAIMLTRQQPTPALQPAPAVFGPLALLSATTPASTLAPGDAIPVELAWQAASRPGEPLVVVLQLLDARGRVAAGLEEEPLAGRYATTNWEAGEIVRDRHTLVLPKNLAAGDYRLVTGVYRSAGAQRLRTRAGLFATSDHFDIKMIQVLAK